MNNDTQSQNSQILAWLKRGRTITPLEALQKFGCLRLGGRIFDLREKNVISTTMIEVDGGKRVARYQFVREK